MSLEQTINEAWEQRASLSPVAAPAAVREAVDHAIAELNTGRVRVAEKVDGQWLTHQWLKKAVLLSFRLNDNRLIHAGELGFFDRYSRSSRTSTKTTCAPPAFASCRRRWRGAAASLRRTSC